MAEEDPHDLEAVLLEAIAPFSAARGTAFSRVLFTSFQFASIERKGSPRKPRGTAEFEIILDERALLKGLIADGLRIAQPETSSTWLAKWLSDRGIDAAAMIAPAGGLDPLHALAAGSPIVLSPTLRWKVLVSAEALARATRGTNELHLRFLCFALLESADPRWFGWSFTWDQLQGLKRDFLERVVFAYPQEAEGWPRGPAPGDEPQPTPADTAGDHAEAGPQAETVGIHSDAPALADQLGRKAFAEVLGARIKQVGTNLGKDGSSDAAFIVHLDGAWGSGKSSVLNFLKQDLERERPPWLVVEFNAWRNQHRKPAWLPVILDVRRAASQRLSRWTTFVWLVWLWWRVCMDWLSYLSAFGFIMIAGLLVWSAESTSGAEAAERGLLGLTKAAEEALKTLGAIIAAVASFLAMARGFTMGSHRNAEIYLETKSEPFRRILGFYRWIVRATHQHVAVFVDDLDRCDSDYVIELLEGLQTSLRSVPIVYVVAGDRKWLCSSFEKRYADFCGEIGTPARPLGYLFLDKVFQLSTSLPRLSIRRQVAYWRDLLNRPEALSPEAGLQELQRLEAAARIELGSTVAQEDIQSAIDRSREDSVERETMLAAAAKLTATPEAARAAEHRLQPFADLLEANPRSMKRLVNAYGLNQARAYLEDRKVSVEALARWTIIELRWPILADFIARSWPDINLVTPGSTVPTPFADMLKSAPVRKVVGARGAIGRLTKANLASILE